MASKAKYCFALLLAVFPPGVVFLAVSQDIHQFESKSPFVQTTGRVAERDCANHGLYRVSYDVEGRTFTEAAGNLYLKDDCKLLKTGETVDVWVSKSDARYVSFVSPVFASKSMASERRTVPFVYPLFAVFTLAGVHFSTTRKPRA